MARTRGKETNAKKAQAEAAAEQAKRQTALVLISPQALKSLLKEDDRYKGDIDSLTGELRETIGNAVEKKKLDKKAYALLKRFHREKSNEKLASLWNTLLAYMDMAGVMDRINSVTALPLDGEAGEEETEEETSEDAAGDGGTTLNASAPGPVGDPEPNVRRPQFGGRRVN